MNRSMRRHYRDAGLLWLFVPANMIHVAEAWFSGFPLWFGQIVGRTLPGSAFLLINGVTLVLLIATIRAATRAEQNGWMAVAIAAFALLDITEHAASAALTQSYTPGLVSGVVLYLPLGALVTTRAFDQAPRAQVLRGIIASILVAVVVLIVTLLSTQTWDRPQSPRRVMTGSTVAARRAGMSPAATDTASITSVATMNVVTSKAPIP